MLTVRIPIANSDALLTTWGAGALARLESSPTETGSYTEVGTAALLSGLFEYYVVDPAGTLATWYRWRPSVASPAGPGDYGEYSAPWVEGGPYLSVAQFRAFDPSPHLTDEALLILLTGAAQAIVGVAGPSGQRTERLHPRGDLLSLSLTPLSIVSVVENTTTLDPTDYEVLGQALRRLQTGSNPRWYWLGADWARYGYMLPRKGPGVVVTYVPLDDTADRQRVQRELVKLEIAYAPGLQEQTIGTWTERYQRSDPYDTQRNAILATLVPDSNPAAL